VRADFSASKEARWCTPTLRWMRGCFGVIIVDARAMHFR
jgi:hypothetical protein